MSHYVLAVFTEDTPADLDSIMEPYYEGLEVESYVMYTKDELIEQEKSEMKSTFENQYAEWIRDPIAYEKKTSNPTHIDYLQKLPDRMKRTDEEIYNDAVVFYQYDTDDDGNVLSTCNPDAKWDWFEVGGRWKDMLVLKLDESLSKRTQQVLDKGRTQCDSAFVPDIDFQKMKKQSIKALAPYDKAMSNSFYKKECMKQRFLTQYEYVERQSAFHTYAVITPDGQWHAPGEMGWFGTSTDTPGEERVWEDEFFDTFIKPAITHGWHLTVVDCHT